MGASAILPELVASTKYFRGDVDFSRLPRGGPGAGASGGPRGLEDPPAGAQTELERGVRARAVPGPSGGRSPL